MVSKNEAFPSKYYRGEDVAKPLNVEIQHCGIETLKNREGVSQNKLVVHFTGQQKSLVCNRMNWDAFVEITGEDDTDLWVGHRVCLFQNIEPVAGKMTPCVRVRAVTTPAKKAPAPAPKKSAPPANDIEQIDDAPSFTDEELTQMAKESAERGSDDDVF